MDKIIMVGCDLHDKSMLNKFDVGGKFFKKEWDNNPSDRQAMIDDLHRRAAVVGAKRIVFAYEASGLGFILHDELVAAGIECFVLAPTGIERSVKHWRRKTDERDAQQVLDLLRAHLLAGNELPSIWIPDKATRDDRELTRARQDLSDKLTQVKTQVRCLLKRNGVEPHEAPVKSWTSRYMAWLGSLGGQRVGPVRRRHWARLCGRSKPWNRRSVNSTKNWRSFPKRRDTPARWPLCDATRALAS